MVDFHLALANISSFAGNRFDLVQAGGGNSSVKLNDQQMLIKASGISLSEVCQGSGYVAVNYPLIRRSIAENNFTSNDRKERECSANQLMEKSKISTEGKPSIETFLHALLNTYTLHTHPISVNVLTAKANWQQELTAVWPDAVCVPYHTPGIDLALALAKQIERYQAANDQLPKVIFLQNHGLIISSEYYEEVEQITDQVCMAVEEHLKMDLQRYRNISQLQKLFASLGYGQEKEKVNFLCSDDHLIQQCLSSEQTSGDRSIEIWPFCPDTLIYCGVRPVHLSSMSDENSIKEYINQYQEYPKVLILDNQVYFCANSLKKAKDAEDLFKFHLLVRQHSTPDIQRLTMDEVAYLSNWDAEKYRQGV